MAELQVSPSAEPFAAYHTLCEDDLLAVAARKMSEYRAEAKNATWETYDSPKTRMRWLLSPSGAFNRAVSGTKNWSAPMVKS